MGENIRCYGVASETPDSIRVFVSVLTCEPSDPPGLTVRVNGGEFELAGDDWCDVSTGLDECRLWWAKPRFDGLEAGRGYRVDVVGRHHRVEAHCIATTRPAAGCDRVHLVVGSCFDVDGPQAGVLERAHHRLARLAEGAPTYNLWMGDQVYVDAPWDESTRAHDARRVIFGHYLKTWGLIDPEELGLAESGLAVTMSNSSNWYLPDDHEFWNGYPDPSWLTLFWHTLRRVSRQIWRARPSSDSEPHPSTQGEWGANAGEAYCLFASGLEFDEFTEEVSPPELQLIETDDLVVVMVDQRWRRTIRKTRGGGFMLQRHLDELAHLLATDTRTVCLVQSKPMIGYLPHRGLSRGGIDGGPEVFTEQYTKLWRALSDRAAAGHPTLSIGGDVHRHGVRGALGGGLIEIVSSPLSLLDALGSDTTVSRARRAFARVRGRVQSVGGTLSRLVRRAEVRARGFENGVEDGYPKFDDDGGWTSAMGRQFHLAGENTSGICGVDIDTAGAPVVTVRDVIQTSETSSVLQTVTLRFEWRPGQGWVEVPSEAAGESAATSDAPSAPNPVVTG